MDEFDGDLATRLQLAIEQQRRWQQAATAKATAQERVQQIVAREQQVHHRADAAAADLAASRSFWPTAWLARLTGAAAARAAVAVRRLDELRAESATIEAELTAAHAELARHNATLRVLVGAPERHVEVLREQEARLVGQGGDVAERVAASSSAIVALQREQKTVQNLLEQTRYAESSLEQARDLLHSARHAGDLDLFAGSVLITAAKFRTYDQARGAVLRAQQALQRVTDDVGTDVEALGRIDIDGGLRLADVLLDGLLVELLSRQKIANAAELVRDVLPKVRAMAFGLERRAKELRLGHDAAVAARIAWLETAGG